MGDKTPKPAPFYSEEFDLSQFMQDNPATPADDLFVPLAESSQPEMTTIHASENAPQADDLWDLQLPVNSPTAGQLDAAQAGPVLLGLQETQNLVPMAPMQLDDWPMGIDDLPAGGATPDTVPGTVRGPVCAIMVDLATTWK